MLKFKKVIFFATIGLAFVILVGMLTLIFSPKAALDSVYDTIILVVSGASIAIAIYSQIEADKDSRRVAKLLKELSEMRKNVENDMAIDKNLRYKLDKIIALDEQIYKKVGGRKRPALDIISRLCYNRGSHFGGAHF